MSENRAIFRYTLYAVPSEWKRLPDEDRASQKKEFVHAIVSKQEVAVYTYSLTGLRAEADLLFWQVARDARELQALEATINGTALGRWLQKVHSLVAMTKPSQYLKGHKHEGQEGDLEPGPQGGTYLFVYPMDKQRAWYRLPYEDRRRMMGEHFKIAHRYPGVRIHTGYSFGIDDQEFVVAFEGESLGEFLDLVEELRGSEASAYTARDVPVFTAIATPLEEALDLLDG